ncbi:hypothetical protein OF83DRAFT_750835 [Amylostereum chailletii]|nr:hypothetical protein OF83DRAFT_750835 [Amylostereum chailletii]
MQAGVQELYREYVSMFAFVYVEALTQKSGYPGLLESKIAHVTLYCWQYASKAGLVKSLTDTVVILSGAFFRLASRADLDAFAQEAIVDTYGAQAFIERIRRDLKASHVFDQSLVSVLTFLIDLGPHPAIMRVLGKVDMFHLILDAAARQTRKSSNKEMEFLVYGFSAIMLYNVFGLNAISLMEACNEDQLVPFLVHGVMLHAQYVNVLQIENMSTLLEFLGKLLRRYRTDKSIPFGDVTSQALAQRLRRVWVSTLDKIRALPSRQSRNKMANMWVFFGEGVGLDEATERARGKVEEPLKLQGPPYCHWKECEFYAKEPRKEMLRCSGCSSVQYCGKECQEKDWKDGGHKRLCKRGMAQ